MLSRIHVHTAPLRRILAGPVAAEGKSVARLQATHCHFLASDALAADKSPAQTSNWIRSICQRLTAWAETCADYYAAASMYEQLSRLSDPELARRGLSRASLAQDVCTASDRSAEREPKAARTRA
jgi:hypothetical protein